MRKSVRRFNRTDGRRRGEKGREKAEERKGGERGKQERLEQREFKGIKEEIHSGASY